MNPTDVKPVESDAQFLERMRDDLTDGLPLLDQPDADRLLSIAESVMGNLEALRESIDQDALTAAVAAIKPGRRYLELQGIAARATAEGLVGLGILRGDPAELVSDGVVALFFPHGVGHLVGLDVHDLDDLGDRATYAPGRTRSTDPGLKALRLDRDLVPGMGVTIEPGFYQVPAILGDAERTRCAGDRLRRDRLADFRDTRGIRIEDNLVVTAQGHENLTRDAFAAIAAKAP